jgi:hypothetical protein
MSSATFVVNDNKLFGFYPLSVSEFVHNTFSLSSFTSAEQLYQIKIFSLSNGRELLSFLTPSPSLFEHPVSGKDNKQLHYLLSSLPSMKSDILLDLVFFALFFLGIPPIGCFHNLINNISRWLNDSEKESFTTRQMDVKKYISFPIRYLICFFGFVDNQILLTLLCTAVYAFSY